MSESHEYTVELKDVKKAFGEKEAVAGISLAVQPGMVFGLLGPNGAGKSTTIRMIMDIIAPDSGQVLLFGRERKPGDLHRVGYLPEERGLYPKMTVLDHLIFLGEIHGLDRKLAKTRSETWLERLDLADRSKAKVEELSKGMQQKIQLAGTLIHEPEVLILDEPFSGLDPINQGLFKDLLSQHKNQGKTLIFSTHVMEQAEKLCDHICLISNGRAVLAGDLAAIKRERGGDSYRLAGTGDLDRVRQHSQVVEVFGDESPVRVLLTSGASGSSVLRELVSFMDVTEFRSEEPDLEQIFIKAVHDAA